MNDEIKNDIEEAQNTLKELASNPVFYVDVKNREHANKIKAALNRASSKINNYNELQSLDKMIDDISDTLEKEK